MQDKDYWAHRFKELEEEINDRAHRYLSDVEAEYDSAAHEIDTRIRAWYQRIGDGSGISLSEARRTLSASEHKELLHSIKDYIAGGKKAGVAEEWLRELEYASASTHISRLDALKLQLRQQAELLSTKTVNAVSRSAELAYSQSYYRTALELQQSVGVEVTMRGVNENAVKSILSKPWTPDNKTFADRCLDNKNELAESVNRELMHSVAGGASPDKAIASVSEQFNLSKSKVGRLIMTESSFFANVGQRDCYKDIGVERYTVVCADDSYTCELCGGMNQQVFELNNFSVGSTAPPFHPWCRCYTAPYFDDTEDVGEQSEQDEKAVQPENTTNDDFNENNTSEIGNGTVDKEHEKVYNRDKDEEALTRYQSALQELAPKTLEEFQEIKYSGGEEWQELTDNYRILNSYKVDSGTMSASEILSFDKTVFTEKRTQFTSKFKKNGNIAGAYLNGDKSKMYYAHSSLSETSKGYKGNSELVLLKEERRFSYISVLKRNGELRSGTWVDTEAKLFEEFADMRDSGVSIESITMLSERGMCDSCKGVMAQFKAQYPDINVTVVSNKQVEGNVWKDR